MYIMYNNNIALNIAAIIIIIIMCRNIFEPEFLHFNAQLFSSQL